VRASADSDLPLFCDQCGAENGLPFDRSFASCDVPCRSCSAVMHWRHCPACKTGGQVESPEAPCPDCGAPVGEREPPAPVPPVDRDRASLVQRATTVPCPACGRAFAWGPARAGRSAYTCPHCGRLLADAASVPAVFARVAVALLAASVLLSGADHLAGAVLGSGTYGGVRSAWIVAAGVLVVVGGVLYVGRPTQLRVYRASRSR
jgi:ribosomal protein L37AE/L43A